MVVRLLSSGIYDKKKILRDNPNIKNYTETKNRREAARYDSAKEKTLRSSTSESNHVSSNQELNYSPLNPDKPTFTEMARQIVVSQAKSVSENSLSWYQKAEKLLRNDLPFGGFSKEQLNTELAKDKTRDLREQNNVYSELYNQELERERNEQIYREQMDLVNNSWYEKFGLFQDNQEKTIRDLQRQQSYYQEQNTQLPNTVNQYEKVTEYIRETPAAQTVLDNAQSNINTGFDWKKVLLISGLGIVGITILTKKI
jgi:hypothetical protein